MTRNGATGHENSELSLRNKHTNTMLYAISLLLYYYRIRYRKRCRIRNRKQYRIQCVYMTLYTIYSISYVILHKKLALRYRLGVQYRTS